MGGSDHERFATLVKQVAELQRKVDFLMKQLNLDYQDKAPDPEAALRPQLEELIRAGKAINAIKLYQMETGIGLREAKDVIDQIEKEIKGQR